MNKLLFLSIGVLIGISISYVYWKYSQKKPLLGSHQLRRGLFKTTLKNNVDDSNFDINYEVEEISKSKLKSKIKIIDYKSSNSKYNEIFWRKTIIDIHDNSWIDTNSIDWIESDISTIRDNKIKQILS